MAIGASLLIDGIFQLKSDRYLARSQIEILIDDCKQLLLIVFGGAVIKYSDGERFRNTNRIRNLEFNNLIS